MLDKMNVQLLHEQLFFVEGDTLQNLGYFMGAGLDSDPDCPGNIATYRFSEIYEGRITSLDLYSILGFGREDYGMISNNCQDLIDAVRARYGR